MRIIFELIGSHKLKLAFAMVDALSHWPRHIQQIPLSESIEELTHFAAFWVLLVREICFDEELQFGFVSRMRNWCEWFSKSFALLVLPPQINMEPFGYYLVLENTHW
jgi:hypothetical protein